MRGAKRRGNPLMDGCSEPTGDCHVGLGPPRNDKASFSTAGLVKGVIFAQRLPHGKNHHRRKSGKYVEGCRSAVMSIHSAYPQPGKLWKTPVEKSVENVEKCELSTGISPFAKIAPTCGKVCIPVCITAGNKWLQTCYVTTRKQILPVKRRMKSWIPWKKCCQKNARPWGGQKIFVKIRQIFRQVSISSAGGYFLISKPSTGGTPCREK